MTTATAIALPTTYRGTTFRSRLEARWAVFFDTLGVRWEYEPEGFTLPSGNYLPDFRLPGLNMFAEIKPERVDDPRHAELVDATGMALAVLCGPVESPPWLGTGTTATFDGHYLWEAIGDNGEGGIAGWDLMHTFVICDVCSAVGFHFGADSSRVCHVRRGSGHVHEQREFADFAKASLEDAYEAARGYRFWEPKE
jgi:hypothetical protein